MISSSVAELIPSPALRRVGETGPGQRQFASLHTLDHAAAARHLEAFAVDVAAENLLGCAQAQHYGLHGVTGIWSQHHEASLGNFLGSNTWQDLRQGVLVIVATSEQARQRQRATAETKTTTDLSITQANTPDPKFSIMCSSAARSVAHAVMTLGEGFDSTGRVSDRPCAAEKR